MVQRVRQFLVPPIYEDEEKTRLAWLVQITLLIVAVGMSFFILSMLIFVPERIQRMPASFILLVMVVGDLWLARKGYVHLAAWLFTFGGWLLLTLLCLTVGGIMSSAFGGFLVLIILAGLLIGKRGTLVFAGLAVFSGSLMLLLSAAGRLPDPVIPPTPQVRFLVFTLYFVFAAALLYLASVSIELALNRARRGEAELAQRNQELQAEIIERKRVEEALRTRETQLRLALEAAQIRLWHWDILSGEIRAIDTAVDGEKSAVVDPPLTFESLLTQVHPDDVVHLQNAVVEAKALSESYTAQYRMLQADGEYAWFEALGSVQTDESGEPKAMVGVTHDITGRKEAEQRQLELAVQKDRLAFLTEFLGNMSHDLRTPLTVIKTSIYLMERLDDMDKMHRRLGVISGQVDLLDRYIDDLLTISRLDTAPKLFLEAADLNHLIQEVAGHLRPSAEKKQLDVRLELQAAAPTISIDTKQIEHVLVNLIENAFTYTAEGGSVLIRTYDKSDSLMVEVQDTGIGIPEAAVPMVFDRFYRADNARLAHKGGTGLGLAIVKKIIEMHHGTIEIVSQIEQGTTFCICLPQAQPEVSLVHS
jgi:signal transduction histidine kinase